MALVKKLPFIFIIIAIHFNSLANSRFFPFTTDAGQHYLLNRQPQRQPPNRLTEGQESNQRRRQAAQLRPGARFTQPDRTRAIYRGMRFIYRTALIPDNFAGYGSDYLWWFYNIESTASDADLRRMARRMGRERAMRWRRSHRSLPGKPDAYTISDYVFGSQAADNLDVRDDKLKRELQRVAGRFSALDYLEWNPIAEPPATDVPEECEYDGAANPRGARFCHTCKKPLKMRSRYDVWYDALITTYMGDTYGVTLGAHYEDVLRWLPTLRPYRGRDNNPDFYDTIYAITHIVYTLNDYNKYRLSPQWLPQEYEFLKTSCKEAIADGDAETVGECMDTLKSFGLNGNDPAIRAGTDYLLSHQNRDGSWVIYMKQTSMTATIRH
jgi:hypothetical protein